MPRRQNPLTPQVLLWAYTHGYFPMADENVGEIVWHNPDPRAILPLETFHIPKSLQRRVRSGSFEIRIDTAFAQVVSACAAPRAYADSTWINAEIIRAYTQLHTLGHAHSVEAWLPAQPNPNDPAASNEPLLVGGLYGIAIGSAFFGESMFSKLPDASKVCLVHLVEKLRAQGFTLLDSQYTNPHMEQFGLLEIPRADYLHRLTTAVKSPPRW